ncbi:hypothetical protein AAHA92_06564 [Salvia divinorum]|uniref:Uncharacterized protein n=1 Tax=Salvia divinorum TaxID=28513 RepID=A0ABD1I954_SALDI
MQACSARCCSLASPECRPPPPSLVCNRYSTSPSSRHRRPLYAVAENEMSQPLRSEVVRCAALLFVARREPSRLLRLCSTASIFLFKCEERGIVKPIKEMVVITMD